MVVEYELIFRLLLAAGLGGLIGIERESMHQPAGLRTHMLIALSSSLITMTSLYYFDFANADVSRIAAGIVLGVGFIGAGTILNNNNKIKGLTTAATVWMVAGIGLGIGAGNYAMSVAAALIAFAILKIGKIEKDVFK